MMGTRGNGTTDARTLRNLELYELQRRARRGPTPEVFFAKHIDNSRIVKADDPERRREMRSFAATMTILFVLVMVYVWQHFSAIEIGYQIEAQKTQVEQLTHEYESLLKDNPDFAAVARASTRVSPRSTRSRTAMRRCASMPPMTAITSWLRRPAPRIATAGGTTTGVA